MHSAFFENRSRSNLSEQNPNYPEKNTVMWIATLLVVLGVAVIGGWIFQNRLIVSIYYQFPTMKANTALGMVFLGFALFGIGNGHRTLSFVSGASLLGLGLVNIIQYAAGISLGVDELIARDIWSNQNPGRMAPGTALSFILTGLLTLTSFRLPGKLPVLYDLLFVIATFGPLTAFFTYLFNPTDLFLVPPFATMALHTTLGFLLFLTGVLFSIRDYCAVGFINFETLSSKPFLFVIGPAVMAPMFLGWAILEFVHYGYMTPVFGTSIGMSLYIFAIAIGLIKIASLREDSDLRAAVFESRERMLRLRLLALIELSEDAVLLLDGSGKILHANPGAESLLGWEIDELEDMELTTLMPERFREDHGKKFESFPVSGENAKGGMKEPLRVTALKKDGTEIPVSITVSRSEVEGDIFSVAIIRNISQLHHQIINLKNEVLLDPLTGVKNRRAMTEDFHTLTQNFNKLSSSAMIMMDLDFFKTVNDRWGHATGDQVLKSFTNQCRKMMRSSDTLYRYGGEEFLIFAENVSEEDALGFAERLRSGVEQMELGDEDGSIQLTVSVGISFPKKEDKSIYDSQLRADRALYRAKEDGRNQVVLLK